MMKLIGRLIEDYLSFSTMKQWGIT